MLISYPILHSRLRILIIDLLPRPTYRPPHLIHTFPARTGPDCRTSHHTICRTPRYSHQLLLRCLTPQLLMRALTPFRCFNTLLPSPILG